MWDSKGQNDCSRLYLPPLWFHHVTNINSSVSFNVFVGTIDLTNFESIAKLSVKRYRGKYVGDSD